MTEKNSSFTQEQFLRSRRKCVNYSTVDLLVQIIARSNFKRWVTEMTLSWFVLLHGSPKIRSCRLSWRLELMRGIQRLRSWLNGVSLHMAISQQANKLTEIRSSALQQVQCTLSVGIFCLQRVMKSTDILSMYELWH